MCKEIAYFPGVTTYYEDVLEASRNTLMARNASSVTDWKHSVTELETPKNALPGMTLQPLYSIFLVIVKNQLKCQFFD